MKKIYLAMLSLVICCAFAGMAKAQQSSLAYIYSLRDESQGIQLYAIDPKSLSIPIPLARFKLQGSEYVSHFGQPNPNGLVIPAQIQIKNSSNSEQKIALFNADGTITPILSGTISAYFGNNLLYGDPDVMQWSPDGRYLAILARSVEKDSLDSPSKNNDIYVFDRLTNTVRNITNDARDQGRFSWSPDSQKIAFVSSAVNPCSVCQPELNIIDISSYTYLISSQIAIQGLEHFSAAGAACLFAWSPNSTKIVYRVNCESRSLYYQELHILDLETNIQSRLTQYTRPPYNDRDVSFYSASQYPVWYDDTLVLVGGYLRWVDPSSEYFSENGFIESYNLQTGAASIYTEGKYIREWAHIASSSQYIASEVQLGNGFQNRSFIDRIFLYANENLQTVREIPSGCNFDTDSTNLYTTYWQYLDPRYCYGPFSNQIFLDHRTNQIVSISAQVMFQYNPIGWAIIDSGIFNPTPTPTSTPMPTSTPTPTSIPALVSLRL